MMLILLTLLAATAASTLGQDVGESCRTTSGKRGVCQDIRQCLGVQDTFRTRNPAICGFVGIFPIVCCPFVEGVTPKNTTDEGFPPDVSPPPVTFECGISRPRTVTEPLASSRRRRRSSGDTLRFLNVPHADALRSKRLVVGGRVSEINAWPWMALLGKRNADNGINWFCGGVLINEQWILTALHCFFDFTADLVRLGEHDYNDDKDGAVHRDINVTETVFYPDFKPPEAYHDLALLRLDSKVTIQRSIRPVCLPWGEESERNITGQTTTITGWGGTAFGGLPSSSLQEVDLETFTPDKCDRSYATLPHYPDTWPRGIGQETLCAGDRLGGRDSCQGDSGGPLVSSTSSDRYVLAGIVSRGYGCGHEDYPGLYANLRHPPYLAWIKKVAFKSP